MKKDSVRFNLLLPKSFLWALNELAVKRGTSVSQLVRDAICQFLKAAGVLCVILVLGCGGSTDAPSYTNKIGDWVDRDYRECDLIESKCDPSGCLVCDINKVLENLQFVEHRPDTKGYDSWKTSCKTIADGFGDCEDVNGMICRAIVDSCIPEEYGLTVELRVIDVGATNHMTCAITHNKETFEVDDFAIYSESKHIVISYNLCSF